MLLRLMRAKDALIPLFLALTLTFGAPALHAQEYVEAPGAEESMETPDAGLNTAPPQVGQPVVGAPLNADGYRPPVEAPTMGYGRGGAVNVPAPTRANPGMRPARPMIANPGTPQGQPAYGESTYVVQPGDTAPLVSKRVYGTSQKWQNLLAYNRLTDPSQLRPGMALRVPPLQAFQTAAAPAPAQTQRNVAARPAPMANAPQGYETASPEPAAYANPAAIAKVPVAKPMMPAAKNFGQNQSVSADLEEGDAGYYGQAGGSYTIQKGDTMGKIAKKLLGSTKRWREISRANPRINPNKLIAGTVLMIPGSGGMSGAPMMSAAAPGNSFDAYAGMPPQPPAPVAYPSGQPNYEPPPASPPPNSIPGAPPAMVNYAPPPVAASQMMEPPPPPVAQGYMAPAAPPSTQTLYRETRYRVPDELKPTDITPYFANFQGYHGLFDTESAMYPYLKTWHFGSNFRYDKYKYLNGQDGIIDGRQWTVPVNLLYTGRKLMVGLSVPFQSWEVNKSTGGPNADLTGLHSIAMQVGYQIWKNYEGSHAVALHISGRFPGDNYHQPILDATGTNLTGGKSRLGVRVGPAEATRGAWTEFGGAYTGKLTERWTSHLNLALANDAEDSISTYIYRGMLDYRVNHNLSLVTELNGKTWEMDNGPDGANVDLLLGAALYNADWQGTIGFPISLNHSWGYGHDFGFTLGLNTRWD